MSDLLRCDFCARRVNRHESYLVRIEAFADPALPPMDTVELEKTDFDQTYAELLKQMENMSTGELDDSVHRRFEFRLCTPCHRHYLANPLGKPRNPRAGHN